MPSKPARKGITTEQRRELRSWAQKQYPKPTHRRCIERFEKQHDRVLSQGTVSESLSARFSYLDTPSSDGKLRELSLRNRSSHFPEVEERLFAWQKRMESKKTVTSEAVLQQRAKTIWALLPREEGAQCPAFSKGWLAGFEKRFGIKSHVRHGEESSVPESAEGDMDPPLRCYTLREAREAVEVVRGFMETAESTQMEDLRSLGLLEARFKRLEVNQSVQSHVERYFH